MIGRVALNVCEQLDLDSSALREVVEGAAGQEENEDEDEDGHFAGQGAQSKVEVEDEGYTEETEEDLRRACQREVRSSVQLQCEVFVEYCTAARTSHKSAVRTMEDRTQVDGFTLQGSTEAYAHRFEALRRELLEQGLVPSDRIKLHSNFECFHLLYTAASGGSDEPPHVQYDQHQHQHPKAAMGTGTSGAGGMPGGTSASVAGLTARSSMSWQLGATSASRLGAGVPAPPTRGWGGKINARPPPPFKARSATWGGGTRTLIGNLASTGIGHAAEARHFPRIGSFEVYLRAWPRAPVQLIHSKLAHGRFRSVADIVRDICIGLRRAAAACELSVWQGCFLPPPIAHAHPPLVDQQVSAPRAPAHEHLDVEGLADGGEEAEVRGRPGRRERPGSPRHFKRVFGSMEPRTNLHPQYPAHDRPVSPRVVSPGRRRDQARDSGPARVEQGSQLDAGGGHTTGSLGRGQPAQGSRKDPGWGGPDACRYIDVLRHGLTPPVYLFADVRAGGGDVTGEAHGAAGAWGLAAMMSSCSLALDAVAAQLRALLTIVESRAMDGESRVQHSAMAAGRRWRADAGGGLFQT